MNKLEIYQLYEEMRSKDLIKMKSITFTDGEDNCFPKTFSSWEDVNTFLGELARKVEGASLKTFFTIEYEGTPPKRYNGRYEVRRLTEREPTDLGAHVLGHALFCSERAIPPHLSQQDAETFLGYIDEERQKVYGEFLDKYEISIKSPHNLFQN